MGLIFNRNDDSAKDYSQMNHLSPEVKTLIVNAQTLVDKARKISKEKGYDFDMTAKMQLRDDCKAVEKKIKQFAKSKPDQKDCEDLELLIIRLETTLKGLLNFFD